MITKTIFVEIILDYHRKELPSIISRDLEVDLEIPIKRVITIMGPRRAGKTFYLYSLIKKLLGQGIEKSQTLYINFENPKLAEISLEDLPILMEAFYEVAPHNLQKKVWLFFDEIQNVKGWESFVRNFLDNDNLQIFISGSSSKLLSKEIATSMRGRTLSYLMLPFSFKEFLSAKQIDFKKDFFSSEEKIKINSAFEEYLNYGGYPEMIFYPKEREKIIREIIEVTIYMDLIERYGIRNIKTIKLMFNYLIKSKEFSVNKFHHFLKSTGIKTSKNTIHNYLEIFNDAFIFFPLKKFSYSLKKIEQSSAKIYTVDNGFITELVGNDKGKKLENLVFTALLKKGYRINVDLFYYKETREVDFVLKNKNNEITELLQVCHDLTDIATKDREIKALLKFSKKFKCEDLTIITNDFEAIEKYEDRNINFIPAWKWLLN